ncbi:YbjQ family protein [uncultured Cocleimonas sp.]|uniref:YbjQ family protein n=1 Tax=uncultured Cocleimonas sp. TaxID=1051587 RepID=UPI0026287CF8|nr:heavy metal-binding domain-containing protein [uncultured Cocleimonas sp.]
MDQILIVAVLVTLGYFFGRRAEKKHFISLIEREKVMNQLPAMASRMPPQDNRYEQKLVSGNVVIANDYFKTFVAGLRNLFGGKISTYETLLDRGRREAVLRMKDQAQQFGAELVFNVKYETSSISGQDSRKMPIIEVHAYGTALKKL